MIKKWFSEYFVSPDAVRAQRLFQVFRFSASIFLSVFLVRFLDLDSVGGIEIIFFVSSLFSFFWINGIKNAMLSDVHIHSSDSGFSYFSYFLIISLFASLSSISASYYYFIFTEQASLQAAFLLGLAILFNAPSLLTDAVLLLNDKHKELTLYAVIVHLGLVIIVGITAWITESWMYVLAVYVFWAFAKWVYILRLFFRLWRIHFDWNKIIIIWKASIYLIFFAFISGLMEYIDGILVEQYFDESQFAIFRYGARELPLSTILVISLSTSILPIISSNMVEGKTILKKHLADIMPFIFVLSSCIMFVTPFLYRWVYSEEFGYSALIFNCYLLILTTRVLLPQLFLYSGEHKRYLIWVSVIELLVNIVLSISFIQTLGLIGVVLATLIAYVLEKLMLLAIIKIKLKTNLSDIIPLQPYFLFSLLLLSCFGISIFVNHHLIWIS